MIKDVDRPINIKDLAIEDSFGKPVPFNSRQEITDQDWILMNIALKNFELRYPFMYSQQISNMHLLFPERVNPKDIEKSERAMENLLMSSQTAVRSLTSLLPREAIAYRILFPRGDKLPKLTTYQLETITQNNQEVLNSRDPEFLKRELGNVLERQALLRIIYCANSTPLEYSQEVKEKIRKHAEYLKRSEEEWDLFFSFAADIIIAGSDPNILPPFDKKTWDKAREILERKRPFKNDYEDFTEFAVELKILAAERVDIDENGIHIIDRIEEETALSLPEVRRY